MWHSCARHREEEHLAGKSEHVVWLYRRLIQMMKECGPVRIVPSKTGIAFQARMRFGGVRVLRDRLCVGFVLTRRVVNPRVTGVTAFAPQSFGHHVDVRSIEDLDAELHAWLREAYRRGRQEHLIAREETKGLRRPPA